MEDSTDLDNLLPWDDSKTIDPPETEVEPCEETVTCSEMNSYRKFLERYSKNSRNCATIPEQLDIPLNVLDFMVSLIISKVEKSDCSVISLRSLRKHYPTTHVRVKIVMSDFPLMFSPHEKWDEVYILDVTRLKDRNLRCYKIPLSNVSETWRNLKGKDSETYRVASEKGIVMSIHLVELLDQLQEGTNRGNIQELYNGPFDHLFSKDNTRGTITI